MTQLTSNTPPMRRPRVTLCFHGVGEMPYGRAEVERPYWVQPHELGTVLATLGALEAKHDAEIQLDFDDANESDHLVVLPLLQRFNKRAAFFVPTDRINQPGFLTASQIQYLARAGMTLGSHGTDHVPWTELSQTELRRQLRHSKDALERLTGQRITGAAAPHGLWSSTIVSEVLAAGYERLHTCAERPSRSHGVLNHRLIVRRGVDVDALISRKLNFVRRAVHKAKDLHDKLLVQAA